MTKKTKNVVRGMTLHRDINLLMSSFMIRQTGVALLSGHYGYAVCGLQHFYVFSLWL